LTQENKGHSRLHPRKLILYIWEICLQHVSAEMGNRQVKDIPKYTKKHYCTYTLFEFTSDIILQLKMLFKGN